jgi:hypothetical protein
MTQEELQPAVDQAGGETTPVGEEVVDGSPEFGAILETLLARITIRYPAERTEEHEAVAKAIDLTNPTIAQVVKNGVQEHVDRGDGSWSFENDFTVNVTVEKV